MRSSFTVENPDKIEFTLTMTMPLKDWKELQDQLKHEWPSIHLTSQINSMIFQAINTFVPEPLEKK